MSYFSNKIYILILICIAPFLTNFMVAAINIALQSIAFDLDINAIMLGWIPTAYLVAMAIFLIPFGKLGDIYGRKKLFSYGIIIFTVASFIAAFSYSGNIIIFARILQGIASALIFSNIYAIATSSFVSHERVRALSIMFTAIFLGLLLGPILGGFLTYYFGWRSIFELSMLIGIFVAILINRLNIEWQPSKGEKFDIKGSIIFGLSVLSIIYGFSIITNNLSIIPILAGLTGLFVFLNYEKRIQYPLLNLELLKNKSFILNNIGVLLEFAPSVPIAFILSLYLQDIRSMTPQIAGLILVLQPITMVIVSAVSGRLSHLMNPRMMITTAMSINLISVLVLSTIDRSTSIIIIMGGLIMSGIGSSLFASPNAHLIMSSVKETHYGVASATITTMRAFGGMFGMSIVLIIISIFLGHLDIAPYDCQGFIISSKIIFIVMGLLYFCGILVSLKNREKLHVN